MNIPDLFKIFPQLDAIAVALLIGAWLITGWLIEHPPAARPSVSVLMKNYRRTWLQEFITRDPRIFDATILDSLRQGTAFFASASMIAIGGGIAMIGNTATLEGLTADLAVPESGVRIELKIILVVALLANALLKFIWSHRLFGYCAVLMAAVPNDPADPTCPARAAQAASINITAAKSFNRGLRSIDFALAAMGWLLGPWALIGTTILSAGVLLRREFASLSRKVMLGQ